MAQPPKSEEHTSDADSDPQVSSPSTSADASADLSTDQATDHAADQATDHAPDHVASSQEDPAATPSEETAAEASEDPTATDSVSADGMSADDTSSDAEQASASDASEEDEAPEPIGPQTFDEMKLPPAMQQALTKLKWDAPTAVQSAAYGPVTEGQDVLVQSQTGSGKTGAFCIPWMAARFEAGDAKDTGVQLLVLTPTRELAKQVCDQLVSLADETDLTPLPVYGGTAIGPQFDALRAGVHAVVGTPGRILDHIRRRTLDLSKVRTVVLDEADEMLSMGFLEDIHSILDACPRERQTTLFSATVPSDIERIARRYMKQPISLKLSGDDIAAAQIEHTYYSVPGTMRTRDLLNVVALEEPGSTLIFCNTREETNLVANVLRKEGFSAEALSSDLSQAAREHVLGAMRKGRLRFLVATDVASRGIDISHISHVFNYSFPQNAESYVHRTGRTGRAGRAGKAISLIGPHDMGNFYHLKLQYPSIKFDEGKLPPKEELEARRQETKLDQISKRFPELVSPEWTLLTRTLSADPRGEQVIAYLLSEAMSNAAPTVSRDLPEEDMQDEGYRGRRDSRDEDRGRGRDRDRGRRGRDGDRDDRGGRDRERDDDRRRGRGRERDGEARRGGRGRERDGEARRGRGRERDGEARRGDRSRDEDRRPRREDANDEAGAPTEGRRRRRRSRAASDERENAQSSTETTPEALRETASEGTDVATDDAAQRDATAQGTDEASALPEADAAQETSATEDAEQEGGGRRRRRRRRRGGRREEGERADASSSEGETAPPPTGDAQPAPFAQENAASTPTPENPASLEARVCDQASGTDAAGAEAANTDGEAADPEAGDDASATDETIESIEAHSPEGTQSVGAHDGASARGRRRRRRRRRRGGGNKDGENTESQATEARTSQGDAAAPATVSADTEDGEDDGADGAKSKRRRRRRRGGRGKKAEAVNTHVPQDQIIIDIDESELEVVRGEFGEIDELDDLTLKGRRRGVIDQLQDEVELEDMSDQDGPREPEGTEESDGSASQGGRDDDEGTTGDSANGDESDDEAGSEGDEADEVDDEREAKKKKRRRRRRRKKKSEEPAAAPELSAPPHKDFWEVWAAKFTYTEFEDETFRGGTEAIEDEPEPPPRPRAKPPAPRRPKLEDQGPLVTVSLNVGRSHGKKAAHIRELLSSDFGLEGRSVRNLTVKETNTEFRVSAGALEQLQAALLGYVFDDIELELETLADEEDAAATDAAATASTPPQDASTQDAPSQDTSESVTTNAADADPPVPPVADGDNEPPQAEL